MHTDNPNHCRHIANTHTHADVCDGMCNLWRGRRNGPREAWWKARKWSWRNLRVRKKKYYSRFLSIPLYTTKGERERLENSSLILSLPSLNSCHVQASLYFTCVYAVRVHLKSSWEKLSLNLSTNGRQNEIEDWASLSRSNRERDWGEAVSSSLCYGDMCNTNSMRLDKFRELTTDRTKGTLNFIRKRERLLLCDGKGKDSKTEKFNLQRQIV